MSRPRQGRPATPCAAAARPACALLVALSAGCATSAAAPGIAADACTAAATSAAPAIRIAVGDRIDPRNAPVPTNSDERLLFAQIYEALLRVDCNGAPVPALAESWSASPDRLTWSFRLRQGIRFSDGTPLDAAAAATSLSTSNLPALAAVAAAGEQELHVRLNEPQNAFFFAQPALSVTRVTGAGAWPVGTGAYRPEPDTRGLRLVRTQPDPAAPDTLRAVRVPGDDPRGALDSGVDLLMTAHAATIAYARLLAEYAVRPLPWNRTYALVSPAGEGSILPEESERESLARDAAATGTRAAGMTSPAWCTTGAGSVSSRPAAATVAYPRGDDIARGMAERIAALSWPVDRTPTWLRMLLPPTVSAPLTARAVDADALLEEMRTGAGGLFVVAMRHCSGADPAYSAVAAAGLRTTPLVDARDHLVHRAGIGSITTDAAGTPRFGPVR